MISILKKLFSDEIVTKSDIQTQIKNDYKYLVENESKIIKNKCFFDETATLKLLPIQSFIKDYIKKNYDDTKGLLLYHSVGSGKTCTSVATVSEIEDKLTTVLWVTRSTLKQDMWKNVVEKSCHIKIKNLKLPENTSSKKALFTKTTKKKWLPPMSYKSFNNMLTQKNSNLRKEMEERNGSEDILRDTFIIIDEAHNLFNPEDMNALERVNFEQIKSAIYNSYKVSKANSCKILLLTATPINDSPLQLFKLLNLLIPKKSNRLPDNEKDFISTYIDTKNKILLPHSKKDIINKTKKLVSYIDRSKDKNYFTQKMFKPQLINKINMKNIKVIESFINGTKNISEITSDLCSLKGMIEEIREIMLMNVAASVKVALIKDSYNYMPEDFFNTVFSDPSVLLQNSEHKIIMKERIEKIKNKYDFVINEYLKKIYKSYSSLDIDSTEKEKNIAERKKMIKSFRLKQSDEITAFGKKKTKEWIFVNDIMKNYTRKCKETIKNDLVTRKKIYKEYVKNFYKIHLNKSKNIKKCIYSVRDKGKNVNDCKKYNLFNDTFKNEYLFTNKNFNKEKLAKEALSKSPIFQNFLKNVIALDKADKARDGKLYKHAIYVDKRGSKGLKLAISLLLANNFDFGLEKYSSKRGNSLRVKKSNNSNYNLLTLSSSAIYDVPISKTVKGKIISAFNERPGNIHGENYRFIIFDGGFKEGVDLFDVKYFHILQTPDYENQITQVIGRATRFCGQSGLLFEEGKGWFLDIFIYDTDIIINDKESKSINEYFLEETYNSLSDDKQIMKKMELKLSKLIINNAIDRSLFN